MFRRLLLNLLPLAIGLLPCRSALAADVRNELPAPFNLQAVVLSNFQRHFAREAVGFVKPEHFLAGHNLFLLAFQRFDEVIEAVHAAFDGGGRGLSIPPSILAKAEVRLHMTY